MNTLRRLVEFEYSRFISSVPGSSKNGIRAAITYFVFLIAGAFYLFRNHDTPEVVFAVGLALSWGIMMNLPMLHIMMIWAQPQREWWLSFPYPRFTLVIAKVIGLVRVGFRIIILIFLAGLSYYGLAISLGMMNPQPVGKIILLAGASLLLAGLMLPVAVVLGLTISMMYSGWARWLLIPYIIIIQSPYVLLGMSMEAAALRFLSPSYMLLYTLGIVVIGWPLAYILMRGIAGIGMKNMADVRLRMKSTASYRGVEEDTKEVKVRKVGERSRFATLYLLERSRYRYYGSILAVRIIKYSLLIIIAVGAYFSSGYPTDLLEMLQGIFMLPVLTASIYTMNRSSIDRKHLQWWLGYPVSRSLLLLSQLAAVWVTAMRVIGALSVVIWAGIAVGVVTGRMEWQDVSLYLEWFAYSLVLYTTVLTFAIGILQSSYYLMKSTVLSIFLVPQYLLMALQSMIINEYLYPDNFNSSIQTPEWSTLGILLALALPIAAFCIQFGARTVHLSLGNVAKPLWKSQ